MRHGESLGLRWSDFDAANKTLKVERALEYTQKFGLRFKSPKSEHGKRSIVLDDFLVELLTKERKNHLRVVVGAASTADIDLSLVRLPAIGWSSRPPVVRSIRPAIPTASPSNSQSALQNPRLPDQAARSPRDAWHVAPDQGTAVHTVAKRLGHDASVLLKVYAKRIQKSDEATAATIGNMTRGMKI
jgi:integrase